jgi:hypothetical protein
MVSGPRGHVIGLSGHAVRHDSWTSMQQSKSLPNRLWQQPGFAGC